MISCIRWGLLTIRWLTTLGFSLLVIQLLVLDTGERRPFVQRLVLRSVVVIESVCESAKGAIFAEPTASPAAAEGDGKAAEEQAEKEAKRLPEAEVAPGDRLRLEPDLPDDFLDQLEQALARAGRRADIDDWTALRAAHNRPERIEIAARLARNLPPQWWTVDGEKVNQLDLPLVLQNRGRD